MLLDTYAWIEIFLDTEKGKKATQLTKNKRIYTSVVTLSEIISWCLRNNQNAQKFLSLIKENSIIIYINDDVAEIAGTLNFEIKKKEKSFGMIDSLIYATAQIYSLKLLTGDKHFRNLDDVIML